ncbi:hypothetical protein GIB67_020695, partial [Kingdonia uniflora]
RCILFWGIGSDFFSIQNSLSVQNICSANYKYIFFIYSVFNSWFVYPLMGYLPFVHLCQKGGEMILTGKSGKLYFFLSLTFK